MKTEENSNDPYQRDDVKLASPINKALAATSILSLGALVLTQFGGSALASDLVNRVFATASESPNPQNSGQEAFGTLAETTQTPGSLGQNAAGSNEPVKAAAVQDATSQTLTDPVSVSNSIDVAPAPALVLPDSSGLSWGDVSSATPSYSSNGTSAAGYTDDDDDYHDDDDHDNDDHDDDDHDDDRDDHDDD